MVTHNINLELTTEQLVHLNMAMNDIYECNFDALDSTGFENERPSLLAQCNAIQAFMDTIKHKLAEVGNAK